MKIRFRPHGGWGVGDVVQVRETVIDGQEGNKLDASGWEVENYQEKNVGREQTLWYKNDKNNMVINMTFFGGGGIPKNGGLERFDV